MLFVLVGVCPCRLADLVKGIVKVVDSRAGVFGCALAKMMLRVLLTVLLWSIVFISVVKKDIARVVESVFVRNKQPKIRLHAARCLEPNRNAHAGKCCVLSGVTRCSVLYTLRRSNGQRYLSGAKLL